MSKLSLVRVPDRNLSDAVESYKKIKAKITFLEEQLKRYRDTIEEYAEKTKDGKIITEDWQVTLSTFETSYFDTKAAFEKHQRLLQKFMRKQTIKRLVIR